MEEILKHLYGDLRTHHVGGSTVKHFWDRVRAAMIEHGNNCYNQALDDAAENAKAEMELGNPFDINSGFPVVDKQSILNLKKQ